MTSYQLIRGSKRAPDTDVVSAALITVLEAHNAALKADVEKLEAMLVAERERADRAIRAIESRAQRLETMAETNAAHVSHRRPWWRRFVA
jgi:uncharacterized coiled-coil protein SlyX